MSELDRVIHEPARLQIVALLSGAEEADFLFLQRETGMTKGNLSSHLVKLEEVGYVGIEKTFRGKIPMTVLRLTAEGRAAFDGYRKAINELLKSAALSNAPVTTKLKTLSAPLNRAAG